MTILAHHLVTVRRRLVYSGLLGSSLLPETHRWQVMRFLGMEVDRCLVLSGTRISGRALAIGEGTFINHECLLDVSAPIRIGRDVSVGPRVSMITTTHAVGPSEQRAGEEVRRPIDIGDGVWIGAAATILPGVTIGRGAVVAAGAVVTRDCAADTLYAGVPARPVKQLEAP